MATITVEYLTDLGRVRITADDLVPGVRYSLQRSTDAEPAWTPVRGGTISTIGVSSVDDYEFTPNVANHYRIIEPLFFDAFDRATPNPGIGWGTATSGQSWTLGGSSSGFNMYVDNGVGVIGSATPAGRIAEATSDAIPGLENGEVTWSAIYPDPANLLDTGVEWAVGLRAFDSDNTYESNLRFRQEAFGYAVELRIGKFIADVFTNLGSTGPIGTWTPGIPWHARFRVQGSTLSARAWQEGTPEPVNWSMTVTDTSLVVGNRVYARGFKAGGIAYEQRFGTIEAHSIPPAVADTATITPTTDDVWLKSITYPLFNKILDCVDWQELTRTSRTGFFDIKGRHEILGIADVGSSATFDLTFITRSKAENRAVVALITYGGVMLLQPPGDDESEECPIAYSGIPGGYVMVSDSAQSRTVYGKPIWQWTITFTRVAPADADGIIPTTITWTQLWDIIGPEGTWEDVWAIWPTWESLWLTSGSPASFGAVA